MVHDAVIPGSNPNTRAMARQGAEAMARFIIENIEQGTWPPGQKLPTERELAARFGISRNTLRKRLDELEAHGRIARQVGSGTYVTEANATANSGILPVPRDDLVGRVHGASPAEVMEFRLLIEPQMVELAVSRATVEDIRVIDECRQRGEQAAGIPEFEHWDGEFHLGLIRSARNQLVTDIYAAVNGVRQQALWGRMKERSLTPERRSRYERQHRAIADALRDRDIGQTRDALRTHLLDVRESLLTL